MAQPETLLERLIPGDLEHQIPAAVGKVLPGGFRNRMIQFVLGTLIAFGFSFAVRRMLEKREAKRVRASPPRKPRTLSPMASPAPRSLAEPVPPISGNGSSGVARPEARSGRHPLLARPHIHLSGTVDQAMYAHFREQLTAAPADGPLVVALSTLGGDHEIARLMVDELRLIRDHSGQEMLFLGKVAVYSAGTTFMAGFPADKRFLTRGTLLMIDERSIERTVGLAGPLKGCAASLTAALHEIEELARIEEEGFRAIIAGSRVSLDALRQQAAPAWYLEAEQARDLGLVRDVI